MYRKDHPSTIQSMFNSVAKRYDLTNAILSLNLHKHWNRVLIKHVKKSKQKQNHVLLDLCSGTGDIAFNYIRKNQFANEVFLIDFSKEMLACAQFKASRSFDLRHHKISYVEADVQNIPLSNSIGDCATMAYGIRNVENPLLCMKEVFRVLKPGGCFGILELTRPQSKVLKLGHNFYLNVFIPLLGKLLTNNRQAYQYLCQSIQEFVEPKELEKLLHAAGFKNTQILPLTGGIATILLGYKPL